ncbi:High affinity cAMP-specific 3',5'-cyclic phosphodiesterase 7A [Hypsibius exemplaris]|uniref:Phosphodiesterase n=1 Tax=Hypsibius exemplaris TaxID=2072580 RepID=A0A9X6N914_HYPEX|nr:High affinity cAMP-specific 3',5'-cyclic phosphodiesterase 7A [Hypsibius exemplaris]
MLPYVRLIIIYGSGRAVISGRFFSLHKNYQRRRSRFKFMRPENGVLVDETYQGPASCLLQHVSNWNFNTFTLDHLTNGRALFHLGVHLFEEYGLIEHFQLDHLKLMKCFGLLEASYHSTNPFHNSIHAADVTQALHCVMQQASIQKHLTKLEIMSAILAAAGHDVDHPGVNQPFLVGTRNYLAALYNNKSVLENHHWRTSICLIRQSGLLDGLEPADLLQFEDTMKTMILATDITRQVELITTFHNLNDKKSFEEILNDAEDRQFVLQIILKCADINNPCRPWAISRIWSQRCVHEFFKQGDRERRLNLPVTAICDRKNNNLPRIQVGFIEYVVKPLFTEWERFLPNTMTSNMLKNLRLNMAKWENLAEEYQNKQAEFSTKASLPVKKVEQPQPPKMRISEEVKAWTSELPAMTLPLFHDSLHREQLSDPRSRRHSVFSETLVRLLHSGDPFVDRVSFSAEPHYRPVESPSHRSAPRTLPHAVTHHVPHMRHGSQPHLTAVTADTDSEGDGNRAASLPGRRGRRDWEPHPRDFEDPEEEGEGEEELGKENSDGPGEATLYYDWSARGPKYFQRKIREEDEQVGLEDSPLTTRRFTRPPHSAADPSATSSGSGSVTGGGGKRRSVPPFLSLFPGGYTGERLVMRRRSDPITPPFGLHQLVGRGGGDKSEEEEDEPPPATLFARRRGSEPVDVLSASQRVFLQGLHHSISASSMTGEHRQRLEEANRRSHHSSPGSRTPTNMLHRVCSREENA